MIKLMAILTALLASPLLAHSWYSAQCCSDHDCHPVPCNQIDPVADGWVWQKIHFDRVVMKKSQDGACHVCVSETGRFGRCIYLPPES